MGHRHIGIVHHTPTHFNIKFIFSKKIFTTKKKIKTKKDVKCSVICPFFWCDSLPSGKNLFLKFHYGIPDALFLFFLIKADYFNFCLYIFQLYEYLSEIFTLFELFLFLCLM